MPAKRGRNKNQSQQKFVEEEKPSNVAFVLCHPMDSSLEPISLELPPCLFPLCNTPVLLYVLNWLSINGIDKIYVICQTKYEKPIQNFIKQCEERMLMDSIELVPVTDPIYSIGDSIRWIYSSNRIDLNFKNGIIVPGTLVTNVPLKNVLAEHEKCVEKDKKGKLTTILTTVFTQASSNGYSAIVDDDGTILQLCIPPEINLGNTQLPLSVDPNLFKKRTSVHVKSGLNDSQIYICSPDLFSGFSSTDNFEWHSILKDCVPSIIWDVEIRMQSVHAEILPESFSSNVNDLPNYIASSLAVIRRWLYPVTIEMNLFAPSQTYTLLYDDFDDDDDDDGEGNEDNDANDNKPVTPEGSSSSCLTSLVTTEEVTSYRLERDLVYLYENVFPSLSAHVGHSVVIGSGSEIDDDCVIQNSVIGTQCKIKKGSVIKNCIIWDRVTIEEGVHVDHSIIACDVIIKKNINISFGCILSFNVTEDINLPPCRRLAGNITDENRKEISFRQDLAPQWLKDYINNRKPLSYQDGGDFFEYAPSPESEFSMLRLWYQLSPDTFPIDISMIEIVQSSGQRNQRNDDEEEEDAYSDGDEFVSLDQDFQKEAGKILDNLIKNGSDIDQIQSEFVVFKNSKYADLLNCAAAVTIAIAEHWPVTDFANGFNYIGKILCSFLSDIETQEDFLFWWQGYCAKTQQRNAYFLQCLQLLIENGALSHEALDSWESQQEDSNDAQLRLYEQYKSWSNSDHF